jgi:uncharacterized protein YndB with AHSA1/START domain
MMEEKLLFRLDEFIAAPIDVVFDYLDDDEKIQRWNEYFVENIYENGKQENLPGTKFVSVQRFEKKTIRTDIVLTEYDPPNKIIMEGYSKEGTAFTRYFLYKEEDGTRIVMESSIIPKNLYYRIITKLFGGLGKFIYKDQINNLREYLEMRDFD